MPIRFRLWFERTWDTFLCPNPYCFGRIELVGLGALLFAQKGQCSCHILKSKLVLLLPITHYDWSRCFFACDLAQHLVDLARASLFPPEHIHPCGFSAETKAEMKRVLADIQSGRFARDWMLENKVNQTSFKATRAKLAEHSIEQVGAKLREMMPWIKERALVDKTKN